ncbi:unnamed protein product [Lymnaea stagnalis]|uniref:Type-1 angiotensin II receptor-associated protein n=1 Tax=Lymnaea stagnalis TaxID=6523 RepID=A0AAV2H4V6_LYMST
MPVSPPGLMLKVIWLTHFMLTSWALFSGSWLPGAYMYTHIAVLAFGFWAIVANESTDAALMFFVTLLFSVLNDILCLALYEPRAHDVYESNRASTSQTNEFRFALGMAITNLILKPVTIFLTLRIYQSRVQGTEYNPAIPGLGAAAPRLGGAYDNIDSNQHHPYGKPSDPPTYQAPGYQEPPPLGHP